VAYGDIQRGSDSSDGSQGGASRMAPREERETGGQMWGGGRKDARARTTGKDEV